MQARAPLQACILISYLVRARKKIIECSSIFHKHREWVIEASRRKKRCHRKESKRSEFSFVVGCMPGVLSTLYPKSGEEGLMRKTHVCIGCKADVGRSEMTLKLLYEKIHCELF